jgi:hypothetical protein
MTPEERINTIAEHVDTATKMLVELQDMEKRTDRRINRLFEITLRIGADFAERIQALEKKGSE